MYVLKSKKRFALTNWTGDVEFQGKPVTDFDGVKLLNLQYLTITPNNNTLELFISNPSDWNIGDSVNTQNLPIPYFYQTYLDPRTSQNVYIENQEPPQGCMYQEQLNRLSYRITINGEQADPDITPTNPVYIELGFYKKI